MTPPDQLNDQDCYLALKARDARFDGCFFTGVTSTGIYCRPVCGVKTPKPENCRFFAHAAQAERVGFRPCLRCRPELAPHSVQWSIQDVTSILAHQAARLLDAHEDWAPTLVAARDSSTATVEGLASKLGVSSRHVRRIFEAQFGLSPMQYLQTRRLHCAKQLLSDTSLAITRIALMSGYTSVRRFNASFLAHYKLNPTQLRRKTSKGPPTSADTGQCITVRLAYRPPYDVAAMLDFFLKRRLDTIEFIAASADSASFSRTFCVESGAKTHTGWQRMRFDQARSQVVLDVADTLADVLPLVIRRVRAMLDLDANPGAINSVLHASFPAGDGLRVPGTLDGFELAIRAVLGQQLTLAAARTLAQRLVNKFGEPVQTPWPQLSQLFPAFAVLAALSPDDLGQLGIIRQRQAAVVGIARAVADQQLPLHAGADVAATISALKALPGVGDWTAHYIAMRALRWPDAFAAGDVALHKALAVQGLKNPAKRAELAAQAWKPWRSYALIGAWSGAMHANAKELVKADH